MRAAKDGQRFPSEAVGSPSWKIFRTGQYKALSNLINFCSEPCFEQGLYLMTTRAPLQPKSFSKCMQYGRNFPVTQLCKWSTGNQKTYVLFPALPNVLKKKKNVYYNNINVYQFPRENIKTFYKNSRTWKYQDFQLTWKSNTIWYLNIYSYLLIELLYKY